MFDQIGGLSRMVRDKTVVIKVNLTGDADNRWRGLPIGETAWTHPAVIGSTIALLDRAGARRIRIVQRDGLDACARP